MRKNVKINPSNRIKNVITVRCDIDEHLQLEDSFNTLFITAKLFGYYILTSRSHIHPKLIWLIFIHDSKNIEVACKLHCNEFNVIRAITITTTKNDVSMESFYSGDCMTKPTSVELVKKILELIED